MTVCISILMRRSLVVILVLLCVGLFGPVSALAALALSNDQAEDMAPSGAPLSAETKRLFQAVRDGELSAVQQAVIDGADLLAVNADNMNAAELAESLNRFTITHFLLAYQAIEERSRASTTLVETEEPSPPPQPPVGAPKEISQGQNPMSGDGIISQQKQGEADPTSTASTIPIPKEITEITNQTSVTSPVSGYSDGTSEEPSESMPVPEQDSGDYFTRLSILNPAHAPKQHEPAVPVEPAGQIVDSNKGSENLASVAEPSETGTDAEVSDPVQEESIDQGQSSNNAVLEDARTAFTPETPKRKPSVEESDEATIFASVMETQPAPIEEVEVPMLAEIPEIPQPILGIELAEKENSFFAQMRVFDEGTDLSQIPEEIETEHVARNTNLLPEYEKIRTAVIEKLRRESNERSKQLADVRDKNNDETEQEDMIREHLSGTQNIQTELRAKERAALTGSSLPPGYVPPPDGGSSGVRFLQRLGLYDPEESEKIALIQDRRAAGLPLGTSSQEQSVLLEAGEFVQLPQLTPDNLAKKSLAFVDHGYSAPPAGRTIDTAEDNAVAALGQIARLFQSPSIGYPSQTSALPQPGTLSPTVSAQENLGGITLPQTTSSAPLNSSDLVLPPPIPTDGESDFLEQPALVPEVPVNPSDFTQSGDTLTQQAKPEWGTTSTESLGNVAAVAPPAPASTTVGLTDQLSQIFEPAQPGVADAQKTGTGSAAIGSNIPPAPSITGSWDVVAVQSAPTAARTLLGGTVVQKTNVAVSGSGALSMGQSVVLGKAPPIGLDPAARKKACIDKRRGVILFCIEKIDWPVELQNIMQVDTVMYQGLNAIVRYDNGVATRFHALFPSEEFQTVVSYYMRRLGTPTNSWRRTISPLAAPERENPTVSWQALNPLTQMTSMLEIRQFDDTRGGFPDEKRGAITLFSAHSGPIFPQVSAFELMRLQPGS